MSRTATKDNYNYLSQKPGLQLIKAGSYEKKELNDILGIPEVKSQILDIPITSKDNAATLGLYSMQEATKGFDFKYDFLEIKTVVSGKFVLSDDQGNNIVAEAGDVVIINPGTVVTFHGESDGEAIYVAHRLPEPTFA
ncbi:cupin domain-containing protein [Peribacillus butanolivorans]|uniref:cupin domain-containing protein n=1 Tax=Peribacillus butanolivorans TaxID=421767 RepID=UPI0030C9FB3C